MIYPIIFANFVNIFTCIYKGGQYQNISCAVTDVIGSFIYASNFICMAQRKIEKISTKDKFENYGFFCTILYISIDDGCATALNLSSFAYGPASVIDWKFNEKLFKIALNL